MSYRTDVAYVAEFSASTIRFAADRYRQAADEAALLARDDGLQETRARLKDMAEGFTTAAVALDTYAADIEAVQRAFVDTAGKEAALATLITSTGAVPADRAAASGLELWDWLERTAATVTLAPIARRAWELYTAVSEGYDDVAHQADQARDDCLAGLHAARKRLPELHFPDHLVCP